MGNRLYYSISAQDPKIFQNFWSSFFGHLFLYVIDFTHRCYLTICLCSCYHVYLINFHVTWIPYEHQHSLANALGKNCVPVLGDKTPTLRSRWRAPVFIAATFLRARTTTRISFSQGSVMYVIWGRLKLSTHFVKILLDNFCPIF